MKAGSIPQKTSRGVLAVEQLLNDAHEFRVLERLLQKPLALVGDDGAMRADQDSWRGLPSGGCQLRIRLAVEVDHDNFGPRRRGRLRRMKLVAAASDRGALRFEDRSENRLGVGGFIDHEYARR